MVPFRSIKWRHGAAPSCTVNRDSEAVLSLSQGICFEIKFTGGGTDRCSSSDHGVTMAFALLHASDETF
jgi:hypothetical protein